MRKLFTLLLSLISISAWAQESMRVSRCDAVDMRTPIHNVYVDKDNNTFVANSDGLFQVYDLNLARPVELKPGEQSLLNFPGGNAQLTWSADDMNRVLGGILNEDEITTAFYDHQKEELWLGTSASGAFRLKVEPSLKLVESYNDRTTKMRSNYINTIHIDSLGRQWIGTEEGVLYGSRGRWKLLERYFDITSIASKGRNVWLRGEEFIGPVRNEEWLPIEMPFRSTEGDIRYIAFDAEGKLWVASEILTRFDTETEDFEVYGPAQYYTSEFASAIAIDPDTAIWVGTEDKGLYLIEKADAMTVNILVDTPLDCGGQQNNAVVSARVVGGQPPYQYQWENGEKGTSIKNLGPGTYALTVTDASGRLKTAGLELGDPTVYAEIKQEQEESADGGSNAVATVTASGGTPGYTYAWDNGETNATARQLTAGSHAVTVTDENGCFDVSEITITRQIGELAVTLSSSGKLNCSTDATASITAKLSGGKAPFSYQWEGTEQTTATISELGPGTYQLTVSDAVGNTATASTTIEAPSLLDAKAVVLANATTQEDEGVVNAVVKGGTRPYSFRWSTNASDTIIQQLAAGTYKYTVTDANGCQATASAEVTEDILPISVEIAQTADIDCAGAQTAALEVSVSGGKAPYRYKWNKEGLVYAKPTKLAAGEYSVTVTDSQGAEKNISISIKEPEAITANAVVIAPATTNNADGKASVKAEGGQGKLTFNWDNGQTGATTDALAAGKHQVTVTDETGCSTVASVDISENILPLTIALEETQSIDCNGAATAAISITANGGKPTYKYKWSDVGFDESKRTGLTAGTYNVTVYDVLDEEQTSSITIKEPTALALNAAATEPASTNGTDGKAEVKAEGGVKPYTYAWDNGETKAVAIKLPPGTHTVTVTDANGCSSTAEITTDEDIKPLVLELTQTADVTCFNGETAALNASVSGGKPPYTYQWSTGSSNASDLSNLKKGNYSLTVSDASGASEEASISISEPNQIWVKVDKEGPAGTGAENGIALADATGGNGNFSFSWDNGETKARAVKLSAGQHSVTVTDKAGCTGVGKVTISEEVLELQASITVKQAVRCADDTDASIEAVAKGGKTPFKYAWSEASLTGKTADGLTSGSYALTITDATGQTATAQVQLDNPTPLQARLTRLTPSVAGKANGGARLSIEGGQAGYDVRWDNGATGQEVKNLSVGAHQLTITDARGCEKVMNLETREAIIPDLAGGNIEEGQRIQIEALRFDADSINVKSQFYPILDEVTSFMEDNPRVTIEIGGHTNSLPPDSYCDQISTARAKSVADYIVEQGIPRDRVKYRGYGKRLPIATNDTPEGRTKNQRVELKILSMGS